jgi:integrase
MARKNGKDRGIVEKPAKSGQWWVRLIINGRERWHRCDSKSQARALYGRLKAEIREGRYFPEKFKPTHDITLRAWILRYLDGSTNRGIENEQRYGRRWSLLVGKRLLSQITTEDLRRIQSKMRAKLRPLKKGRKDHEDQLRRQWSDATINRHFAFVRHVLALAVKDGKLTRNPATGIKFFPESNRTRYLNGDELNRLHAQLTPPEWHVVAFAIETGMRREEQFSLRWDQVDLETGILTIPLPKGGKTRHVPLSDGATAILRAFDSFLHSPWVFASPKNPLRHWNAQSFVNHVFTPALRKAGITGVCWHSLRHTAASRRIMDGVDLIAVKEPARPSGYPDDLEIFTPVSYASPGGGQSREFVWNWE